MKPVFVGFSGALEFGERLGSDGAARGVAGSLTGAAAQARAVLGPVDAWDTPRERWCEFAQRQRLAPWAEAGKRQVGLPVLLSGSWDEPTLLVLV